MELSDAKLEHHAAFLDPKLAQVGPKLASSWAKLAQVGPKLAPSWPQVGPSSLRRAATGENGPQVGASWPQVGLKLGQVGTSWPQIGPKLGQVGFVGLQQNVKNVGNMS